MMINFALNCLDTEVTCDKISKDGYEARNLLSLETGCHHRGFLAESFITPPVNLTFKFPCPVNLKSIVIDPKVGAQRSSVIEIYVARHIKTSTIHDRNRPTLVQQHEQPSEMCKSWRGRDVGESNSQVESAPIFRKVGSISSVEPGKICFYNPFFNSNIPVTQDITPNLYAHCTTFRHHPRVSLSSVDWLSVRIVRTLHGSVAAIGHLEIWGTPARSCSPQLRNEIEQKYSTAVRSERQSSTSLVYKETLSQTHTNNMAHSSQSVSDNLLRPDRGEQNDITAAKSADSELLLSSSDPDNPEDIDIPEDFLDAITCEIMSVPLILPSGKSIDISTLDRLSDSAAALGRQPSDPFTGLEFTLTRKPIVNTALKVRIDHFLSKNANKPSLQNVPRTLGRSAQYCEPDHLERGRLQSYIEDNFVSANNGSSLKHKMNSSLRTVVKAPRLSHSPYQRAYTGTDVSTSTLVSKKLRSEEETASGSQTGSATSRSEVVTSNTSHEERLKTSLNSAVLNVLRKLPTFSDPSSPGPSSSTSLPTSNKQCVKCHHMLKQACKETKVMYLYPCQHLVCRVCLLNESDGMSTDISIITCDVCDKQFRRADLTRAHV